MAVSVNHSRKSRTPEFVWFLVNSVRLNFKQIVNIFIQNLSIFNKLIPRNICGRIECNGCSVRNGRTNRQTSAGNFRCKGRCGPFRPVGSHWLSFAKRTWVCGRSSSAKWSTRRLHCATLCRYPNRPAFPVIHLKNSNHLLKIYKIYRNLSFQSIMFLLGKKCFPSAVARSNFQILILILMN